jgi:uncharacterized membrane protein YecN with MAPEG domain
VSGVNVPVVTALYASILGVLGFVLAARVIAGRVKHAVEIGDAGNEDMVLRIRAFGNFVEYVPLVLVLSALAEGTGTPRWSVHAIGLALLCGRVLHGWGLSRTRRFNALRFAGTNFTFAALLGAAAATLWAALSKGAL